MLGGIVDGIWGVTKWGMTTFVDQIPDPNAPRTAEIDEGSPLNAVHGVESMVNVEDSGAPRVSESNDLATSSPTVSTYDIRTRKD